MWTVITIFYLTHSKSESDSTLSRAIAKQLRIANSDSAASGGKLGFFCAVKFGLYRSCGCGSWSPSSTWPVCGGLGEIVSLHLLHGCGPPPLQLLINSAQNVHIALHALVYPTSQTYSAIFLKQLWQRQNIDWMETTCNNQLSWEIVCPKWIIWVTLTLWT